MKNFYLTNNAAPLIFFNGDISIIDNYLKENFTDKNINWQKDLLIKIYEYELKKIDENNLEINVYQINKSLKKFKNYQTNWTILFNFKNETKKYSAKIHNPLRGGNKSICVLWDIINKLTNKDCKKECDENNNLEFKIKHEGKLTSHAVLTLFFQKKENCNKLWKYKELEKAMISANSNWNFRDFEDRGLGGERPREWKNHMGYEFITNEKNRSIPDGSVKILSPIPSIKRNERRSANFELLKEDWSGVLKILQKNKKMLRCFFCGRFEGEINRINEKTIFQKGHLTSLTSGGDVSQKNIMSQCQYCNNTLNDFFDFEENTLKMRVNPFKAIEKQDQSTRIKILDKLLNNMLTPGNPAVNKILDIFIKKRK